MKKSIIFSACVVVLAALSSCSTPQQASYSYTARQSDIVRQSIQATPTIVDVVTDYAKRVVATSDWQSSKEEAMNECRFLAITENKIDIVVDPIFKVESKGARYQATLTGYAGYYANPRGLIDDIKAFKELSKEDIEKYLMLHNPEVLQYLQNTVVNINHNNQTINPAPTPAPKKEAPAPAPAVEQPRPQPQPVVVEEPTPAPKQEAPAPAPKAKKKTNRYTRARR